MTRTTRSKTGKPIRAVARILVAGLIGAVALSPIGRASAQTKWIDRNEVVEKLAGEYAESPTAMGLASTGGVIELFTAPDGETWTMVLTRPDGSSRIIVTGEGWSTVPIRVAGRDS